MKTGVYNQATIAEVQERYHGILDYGDSDGEGQKQSYLSYILKIELSAFVDVLDMDCERKRKVQSFCPKQLMNGGVNMWED